MKTDEPHNNISEKDLKRVVKYLTNCGPYTADLWSNSYLSEIVDFLNEQEILDGRTDVCHNGES